MKKKSKDNKNYTFVFLYAIGSILIVAGHCRNGGINLFFDIFPPYAFHLGLFMFCSGYFYKSKNEDDFKEYFLRKFKRLIIPMYVWNVVYGIFVQLSRIKGFTIGFDFTLYNLIISPLIHGHQFSYNMCFWFIPELFLIEMITCLLRKVINKISNVNEYLFFVFYLFLGILGVYLSNKGFNRDWFLLLVRTLFFFPFFGMGILYNRKLEKYDKLSNIEYFSIVLLLQFIIIFIEGKAPSFTPSWCRDFTDNLLLPFMTGYLGIAFWLRIAKIFESFTIKSKIINTISDNALPIMAHQFLGFFILKFLIAVLSKITPLFQDFSFTSFKTNIWYYYVPNNTNAYYFIYLVFGLVIPIIIAKILEICKKKLKKA